MSSYVSIYIEIIKKLKVHPYLPSEEEEKMEEVRKAYKASLSPGTSLRWVQMAKQHFSKALKLSSS